jgi:diacylglycerol O-acyltransferase / wax synthase
MDAAFLAMESPELPLHVVGVVLLDPAGGEGWSSDRFRDVVRERLHRMPPFCRRLVEAPLSLDRPYWHYETPADLDVHVIDATLPAPGDMHALGEFVGEVTTQLLDRSRPLWQLYVVDGLSDGRVALVAKVHHSTLYGAAGAEFIAELLDLEASPAASPAPPRTAAGDDVAAEPPDDLAVIRRTLVAQLKRPVDIGRLAARGARGVAGTAGALGGVVRRHGRSALPAMAPSTRISGAPTTRRTAAFAALSLEDARVLKGAAGVKLNDVVLATVAVAVRRYLAARGELPDRIVAGVPVNAGEGDAAGTNTLATMLVGLPMQELPAGELLSAVHDAANAAKAFTSAVGPGAVAELADVTPPVALSVAMWLNRTLGLASVQPSLLNLVVSNVMGPPIPLFLAGARVDAIYPLGPLLPGAGMNITVLSNLDRLDVGVMACPDLVEDVWELVDSLPDALDQLLDGIGEE